jgi:anti-sigma regulatory factor (Ser/Thr protein kinase)
LIMSDSVFDEVAGRSLRAGWDIPVMVTLRGLDDLSPARRSVSRILAAGGVDEDDIFEVLLALSELATTALRARTLGSTVLLRLVVRSTPDGTLQVACTVRHAGPEFRLPAADESASGARVGKDAGLRLVGDVTDDMWSDEVVGGAVVSFRRRLARPSSRPVPPDDGV